MQRGITILELLMVMVVIGIVTAMSVPRINTSGHRADASARAIRGALQIAQRSAITRQSNMVVLLDSANRRISLVEDLNGNLTADAGERITHTPLEEGTTFIAPSAGRVGGGATGAAVLGSSLQYSNGLPRIVMRRDGSASSDVEIYLTARPGVPADLRAITVNPAIGKAELHQYTGNEWRRVTQ
jgi:prepilin-type N-terminal cleavage/methylation domain-containing protein